MNGFSVNTNRQAKASKIEAVLCDYLHQEKIINKKILDIGCGSGAIAQYFSICNDVYAVDVEIKVTIDIIDQINFDVVKTESLPFGDNSFDIVLSNHVIEHLAHQDLHLSEIKRVLKKNGVCYFATPNKNYFIEPHYKIPLIHYLPRKYFNSLLKLLNLYEEDLNLLTYKQMLSITKNNNFMICDYTCDVLKMPYKYCLEIKWTAMIPRKILLMLRSVVPTNIFVIVPCE